MKLFYVFSCLLLISSEAFSTSFRKRELKDLVEESDHIVIGKVTKVTMYNDKGRQITNPFARTGPGKKHEIRFHISIEKGGILKTTKEVFPEKIVVPRHGSLHLVLGQEKRHNGMTYIFLLKGEDLRPVYPPSYGLDLNSRSKIEKMIKTQKLGTDKVKYTDDLRIAIGMDRGKVTALLRKNGAIDITAGLDMLAPKVGQPLTYVYWEFRDCDAIISLTHKNRKITAMTYWTKHDFGENKTHRFTTAQKIKEIKVGGNQREVSIEKIE